MTDLLNAAAATTTRASFVAFVRELANDLEANPAQWVNTDLASFLEGLGAWVDDMDGYYLNQGKQVPERPGWETIADMLMAARSYE